MPLNENAHKLLRTLNIHARRKSVGSADANMIRGAVKSADAAASRVRIAGVTHLITPVNENDDSLLYGYEAHTLEDNNWIEVDFNKPLASSRGPNVEIKLNARQDTRSNKQRLYQWYPVSTEKYKGTYVRHDAINAADLPSGLARPPSGASRQRAAPVKDYTKFATCGNVKSFLAAQRIYQQTLAEGGFSKQSLLDSHASVGFEYEFTHHNQELPSHIVLAKSSKMSDVFDLHFALETDSGNVLELVMPPVLVPRKEDGQIDIAELQSLHNAFSRTLHELQQDKNVRGKDVKVLLDRLAEDGFGSDWTLDLIKSPNDLKATTGGTNKLKNGPYAQMNISMTADEAAAAVHKMYLAKPTDLEGTPIIDFYNGLKNDAQKAGLDEAVSVHLCRAMASLLALPSLLEQARNKKIPEDQDLTSQVKESHFVWMKDVASNILKALPQFDGETKNNAVKFMRDQRVKVVKQVKDIVFANDPIRHDVKNALAAHATCTESMDKIRRNMPTNEIGVHEAFDTINEIKLERIQLELVKILDPTAKKAVKQFNKLLEDYQLLPDSDLEVFKNWFHEMNQAFASLPGALSGWEVIRDGEDTMTRLDQELHALLEGLGDATVRRTPKMEFGEAGTPGYGVRGDTHLKQPDEVADADALRTFVTELRSGNAIEEYFKPSKS